MKTIKIFIIGMIALVVLPSMDAITIAEDPAKKIYAAEATEGDGARVKRLFPNSSQKHFDPFVMMDEFFVTPPAGFPPHPHRGFEAVTYMLDGAFNHKDNLGNNSTVSAGGAQRFNAGSGIVHSEMPGSDEVSHGIQLWINLEKDKKKMDASYQEINASEIPEERKKGKVIRHIIGNGSPVTLQTEVIYQDVQLEAGVKHNLTFPQDYQSMIYCIEGKVRDTNGQYLAPGEAFVLKGSSMTLESEKKSRFIVLSGKPHNQPIRQRGSYVD